jgi:hypothetical protein
MRCVVYEQEGGLMRCVVYEGRNEVLVFQAHVATDGTTTGIGEKEYFGKGSGRDPDEYDQKLIELPLMIKAGVKTEAEREFPLCGTKAYDR